MKHPTQLPNLLVALLIGGAVLGCTDAVERPPPPDNGGVHGFANGCYAVDATDPGSTNTRWLVASESGEAFTLSAQAASLGSRFFMKATDIGTYLFYDAEGQYLSSDDGPFQRLSELDSDILLVDDSYISGAEWEVQVSPHDPTRFQLRHLRTGRFFGTHGLTADEGAAAVIAFYPQTGCAEFPELTVDAEGEVLPRRFDDGSVYGIADTHSHLLSNFGFGGGGIFHGSTFHRLGVEHALPDCGRFHGPEGRHDLFGYGYDQGGEFDADALLTAFISGRLAEFNHHTAGYPEFTDWPNAPSSSTHQTQYYRWLQRAHLGGLRLVVQHATSNSVICELMTGSNIQPVRYSCNDMVAIDRVIDETYAMERYIDAQEGGPGQGWFRVVTSPEQARAVIDEGKMAVLLGIEVSNLFDCFLTPPAGTATCDAAEVVRKLDDYYERGVRVMFPVHKYDNAFSAGDGSRSIIEIGNFINSGHWSNFTTDCDLSTPTVFDRGDVVFGGLNMTRADYLSAPPNDLSSFSEDPVGTLFPYVSDIMAPRLEGEYCQNTGLTALGETLLQEMMTRGMIIEIDHFPRRSYARAFELLEANDYPPAGTHGLHHDGRIYALGGVSKTGLGRCHDPDVPGTTINRLRARIQLIADNGGYPAEGFGFDLNGFAGAAGARFGDDTVCSTPQEDPVTYPFTSYAGDVTFHEPQVGNRAIDFNTEGMVHIGLMPELIEDVRRDGVTDEELEPLFRSAEAYIRMWEKAERRAAALR
ncbi:MAG: hypothetical protein JRH11_05850 [Deltaproteobacteria bacterium]|nr:hypothetical protein [Deltaproteobacteria bacterium]